MNKLSDILDPIEWKLYTPKMRVKRINKILTDFCDKFNKTIDLINDEVIIIDRSLSKEKEICNLILNTYHNIDTKDYVLYLIGEIDKINNHILPTQRDHKLNLIFS